MEGFLVTFQIRADLAKEIKQSARENGMFFNDYLAKLVEDAYYTEKYGDLNIIFRDEEKKTEDVDKVEHRKDDVNESIKEGDVTIQPHISEGVVENSPQEDNENVLTTNNDIGTDSNGTVKSKRTRRKINTK